MSIGTIVLAAEDEESDAFLLKLAFEHARISTGLVVLRDGQELVDYLERKPPFSNPAQYPVPELVFLDLKMPRMDGFGVLNWVSFRPQFHHLPFIVFSASTCEADMRKSYQLGASDYVAKPSQFTDLVRLVSVLHKRWIGDGHSTQSRPLGLPVASDPRQV